MPVKIFGIPAFQDTSQKVREATAIALNRAAASSVDVAKQLAPVSADGSHGNAPGYLRDHIRQHEIATPDNLQSGFESAAEYSVWVEEGTVDSDAQPYMEPARVLGENQLREEIRPIVRYLAGK